MTLIAAADGSALGNPGPAGWAWYIDDERWKRGGWKKATNNQGELMAVLSLLQETRSLKDQHLLILCDSQYVINSMTKWLPGWKNKNWRKSDGKPVLNVDFIKSIDDEMKNRNVTFQWVKGHAGHELNEIADELARGVALSFQKGADFESGPGFGFPSDTTKEPAREQAEATQTLF